MRYTHPTTAAYKRSFVVFGQGSQTIDMRAILFSCAMDLGLYDGLISRQQGDAEMISQLLKFEDHARTRSTRNLLAVRRQLRTLARDRQTLMKMTKRGKNNAYFMLNACNTVLQERGEG